MRAWDRCPAERSNAKWSCHIVGASQHLELMCLSAPVCLRGKSGRVCCMQQRHTVSTCCAHAKLSLLETTCSPVFEQVHACPVPYPQPDTDPHSPQLLHLWRHNAHCAAAHPGPCLLRCASGTLVPPRAAHHPPRPAPLDVQRPETATAAAVTHAPAHSRPAAPADWRLHT